MLPRNSKGNTTEVVINPKAKNNPLAKPKISCKKCGSSLNPISSGSQPYCIVCRPIPGQPT